MDITVRSYFLIPWWGILLRGLSALLFGLAAIFWPGLTLTVLALLLGAFLLVSGVFTLVGSLTGHNRVGMWWLELLVGLIELGVGIYLIRNPELALNFFILLLGITLIFRGVMDDIVVAFDRNFPPSLKLMSLLGGAISILAGAVILLYPVEGSLAFVWVLGLYAILSGVLAIALSFDIKALHEAEASA